MKTLVLITILFVALDGCVPPKEKPFIVVSKYPSFGRWNYAYQDKHGNLYDFTDTRVYFIGDTLK